VTAAGISRRAAERRTITPELAVMLAEARRARGWSLREAARRIGCTPGSVVHWERGRRAPSAYYALKLVRAYGLGGPRAARLLDEAVEEAGMSSPWREGQRRR